MKEKRGSDTMTKEDLHQISELLNTKLDEKLQPINDKINKIEMHLENVTDKNIKTVAEGHLDLSRKLDKALSVENEKELLIIRVRMLEDEVQKIKDRLDKTA